MKIRFLRLTKVSARIDICECTGECTSQLWEFDPGEELEVLAVNYGPSKKVKTRPDRPGGRLRRARLTLKNNTPGCKEHNYLDDVLETDFEVL